MGPMKKARHSKTGLGIPHNSRTDALWMPPALSWELSKKLEWENE